MKIRFTNKKENEVTEMVVVKEYKSCYACKVTNLKYYEGYFRIYKNWIGMDNNDYKVETVEA
jgi:hypothetical protein